MIKIIGTACLWAMAVALLWVLVALPGPHSQADAQPAVHPEEMSSEWMSFTTGQATHVIRYSAISSVTFGLDGDTIISAGGREIRTKWTARDFSKAIEDYRNAQRDR